MENISQNSYDNKRAKAAAIHKTAEAKNCTPDWVRKCIRPVPDVTDGEKAKALEVKEYFETAYGDINNAMTV